LRENVEYPGGASASSSYKHTLFGWESVANYFDFIPLDFRKDIFLLESKEFDDEAYL